MARISEVELKKLKMEISLQRLVEASGIELTKHGNDYIGLCPFHNDKEPSLVISPKKNLWHCLGACQTGGSVIDWVMKYEGVSFRHAVELLRADYFPAVTEAGKRMKQTREVKEPANVKVESARIDIKKSVTASTTPKLPLALEDELSDNEVLARVVNYYHQTLKQSPAALNYLKSRGLENGLENPEFIDYFKIGYADRTLAYRLPYKNRKLGNLLRSQLQRIGILRKSGHEHFNGSIVIPIFDENSNVMEIYGRKVIQNLRKGTPKHLYLPGAHKGLFNHYCLAAKSVEEIILCESIIDALTFWCAGYKNVTCSYGVEGFTSEMLEAFKKNNIRRILIAYDRDDAGTKAAEKLANKLNAEGIDCFRILFPKGMDANEYALQVKPAVKSLGIAIRKAEWMGNGKGNKPTITTNTNIVSDAAIELDQLTAVLETEQAEDAEDTEENLFLVAENESENKNNAVIPEPATATPMPKEPKDETDTSIKQQEIIMKFGDRRYRIRGLSKNLSYEQLKINILCSCDDKFHVDSLELYSARHRAAYIKQASLELNVPEKVIKNDLGKVLLKLESLQDEQIKNTLKPKKHEIIITDPDKQKALELLKSENLLEKILEDFEACGIVGEETNKLVGYLACVSRKLENPLAIVIQSSSAAGKSSLMESILNLVPQEDRIQYSAMTGQSLFYVGKTDLKNKILAIAEEEGAEQASYALKLLQSEGELTIASTGKDTATGKLITHEYHVEGPVMMFLTTTAIEVDEELLNRCIVLTVNESREQTKAIHNYQRQQQTLSGLLANQDRSEIKKIHQNAQRLLRPVLVANPYADKLTFLNDRTRTRRDHMKYLTLIRSIALLHQYQRPVKTVNHNNKQLQYIEVTKNDIEIANKLAHEVLGRTLDELPPQTRNLLNKITDFVNEECKQKAIKINDYRFTRRKIREITGWGNTQLKVHLRRLEELEYLLIHKGGRGQSIVYELLYNGEGDTGKAFIMGLINPDELDNLDKKAKTENEINEIENKNLQYDANRSGLNAKKSASGRVQVAPKSGLSRDIENGLKPSADKSFNDYALENTQKAYISEINKTKIAQSYL